MNPLALIGHTFLEILSSVGRLGAFTVSSVSHILRPPFFFRQFMRQMIDIGYFSLPVVGLTSLFTGMVLALQSYTGFSRFEAEGAIATVVVLSVTRELGPVMAGLMVAGRIGAAMAAELGTMRVTEQIDALTTLSTNPFKYLIVPRLLAATIALPLLVVVGDIIGVFGGFLVSVYRLQFNAADYISETWAHLEHRDVASGLWKAAVFGFIVALMGCYNGFNSKGGAQGVGAATTNAVVTASILILLSDYLMTGIFFSGIEGAQLMPTVSTFYGILIQFFWRDHAPPHFHAIYGEYEVMIDIRTLEVIEGNFPRRAVALVLEWAQQHRNELMEDWELCSRDQKPKKIPPLA